MIDERGTETGELPPETLMVIFDLVPTGVSIAASLGGSLVNAGSGSWTFSGTPSKSNGIQVSSGPGSANDEYLI